MKRNLNRLRKEIKNLSVEEYPYISLEEMQDMCKYLSKEAAEDVMKNGYKDGNLIYKNLKTETLIEIVDPEASKILIVGTGDGTRVFMDDIDQIEDQEAIYI